MPSGLKRYQGQGSDHFITFSCYQRLHYLDTDQAKAIFETELEKLRLRHQFKVFGYVLMTNHVHLLMSEPKQTTLAKTLNVLQVETSRQLNGDRKQFWQTRYYDFNVLTHDKFDEKLNYIHQNPVTAGLVETPEAWPWSSARHYLTGEEGRIEIESEWTFKRRQQLASHPSA